MVKIVTHFEYPPIPNRNFDWYAIDDDRYDGEGCPMGHGRTEREAVDDLLSKICVNHGGHADVPDCGYCGAAIGEKCPAKLEPTK